MSAPWEVFVSWGGGSKQGDGLAMPKDSLVAREPNVRYLRADLTCGECEKKLSIPYEPYYCEIHTIVNDADPACMAFVPKVQP